MTEKKEDIELLEGLREKDVENADQPEEEERDQWNSKIEFFLSLTGLCIGLGNIWRFPYLCYKNGGGAFLIPYLLTLVLGGIPTLYLEMLLGQSFSVGGLGIWKYCRLFKGVGYAAIVMAFWLSVYYIVVLAYALYYMFRSLTIYELDWSTCGNPWNSECCSEKNFAVMNQTLQLKGSCASYQSPALEYWKNQVLQQSQGIDYPDGIRWPLAGTLLLAWTLCFLAIFKGVKWTGKVVYFTALFPYVLLICLFFRAVTLDGAILGIQYYLYPDFSSLGNSEVWLAAASQIFFTYGLGLGSHIALASYNKRNNNCQRDALAICLINTCTSLFSGLVIFSIIGYLSRTFNVPIDTFAETGYGLAFVVYATAVTLFPGSNIWAFLFFFMILLVGLDSQFCTLEGLVTAVVDEWPGLLKKRRSKFIFWLCLFSFIIGMSTVSRGGSYVISLFDHYAASGHSLLLLIFFQCIAFSWSFGINKMSNFFEKRTGIKMNLWWKICWVVLCPAITLGISIFSIFTAKPLKYNGTEYPTWSLVLGRIIGGSSVICIPVYALYYFITEFRNQKDDRRAALSSRILKILRPEIDQECF